MRNVSGLLAGLILMVFPMAVSAQTVDNSQLISLLQQLVATLEQQLAVLVAARDAATVATTTPVVIDTNPVVSSVVSTTPASSTPVFGSITPSQPSCVLTGTTTEDSVELSWNITGAARGVLFPRLKIEGGKWVPLRIQWDVATSGTMSHLAPQISGFELNVNGVNTCSWQ